MIALLRGRIALKSIDHLVLDVGGVGYRLLIPLSTFYALPDEGETTLVVHTHVREDAIHLYGFLTEAEKQMFQLLIGVSGIGPKLAINILSHIPAQGLCDALRQGDIKRLSALPGIGKKTAERLVLELKEKIQKLAPPPAPTAPGLQAPVVEEAPVDPLEDVLSALVNLGYKEAQARKILESMEIPPGTSVETVLKGALRLLMP